MHLKSVDEMAVDRSTPLMAEATAKNPASTTDQELNHEYLEEIVSVAIELPTLSPVYQQCDELRDRARQYERRACIASLWSSCLFFVAGLQIESKNQFSSRVQYHALAT